MRQIVLDTETTGLNPTEGHKIIEIGLVELVDRRLTGENFHVYLNPDRAIDAGAMAVHGITNEFLSDKPRFLDIAESFLEFIGDSELIIHNAPFDMGFLTHEIGLLKRKDLSKKLVGSSVTDTLVMARRLHPGQKNNLDALSKRYNVDNMDRTWHGALLDAKILALVYLAMTGGQGLLFEDATNVNQNPAAIRKPTQFDISRKPLRVIYATSDEQKTHQTYTEKFLCH
jgi:DNA polymerase III subunit epsilon